MPVSPSALKLVETLVTRTSVIVTTRYSCWPVPALRTVIVAVLMCTPVAHAFISSGEALSTWWVKLNSWKLALPAPPPPPWLAVPDWDTPHDHDRTSISSLCLTSLDSPLIVPMRAKIDSDITHSSP